jgi:tetratricopeptide (TPR) repeat protein
MDDPAHTRVFISYSHDSTEHRDRVRRLADRLILDGMDAVIDLDEPNPPEGWWGWMVRQLADADFVLVVCTEGYFQRATAARQAGHGAKFESVLLVQMLYDSGMWNERFVPVLFEDLPSGKILAPLRPYSRYRLDRDAEYTDLLRLLTRQPKRIRPPRGKVPELPPEETATSGALLAGTPAAPAAVRQPGSASGTLPAAPPLLTPWPALPRRWREALLRGPLRRRRIVLPAVALALLAALGFGAARWLCASRGGAAPPLFGLSLLSSICTPDELYRAAMKSWETLDLRRSRQLLDQAIAKRPDDWLALSGLAVVLHQLGRDDLAAGKAKLAGENAGRLSREERLLVTARCSWVDRRWEDAVKSYEELHRSFPDRLEYGLGWVNALTGAGRLGDALDALHALQAQPAMGAHAARLDLAEAEAAYRLSDGKRMLTAATRAEREADRRDEDRLRARAWFLEGLALLGHDPENSLLALKRAEDFYARTADRPSLADALDAAAEVLLQQGNLSEARAKTDEALEIKQELDDRDGQASERLRLAIVDFDQGNTAEAERLFAAAIGDYRLAGNRQDEARVTANLGIVLARRGHHDEAVKYHQAALRLYRELGDRGGEAAQRISLAESSLEQASLPEAEAQLSQAKDLATALGSQVLIAEVLAREGDIAAARGQLDVARDRYRDAQRRYAGIDDKNGVAVGDLAFASLELDQCEIPIAQADARKALGQFHLQQVADQEAQAGAVLALALMAGGSLPDAETELEQAERLAGNSQDPDVKIAVALARGRLHAATGRSEEALRDLAGTLEQARRGGLGRRAFEARLALGEIEATRGDRKHAAEILTALEKAARSHGFSAVADRAARLRAGAPAGACRPTWSRLGDVPEPACRRPPAPHSPAAPLPFPSPASPRCSGRAATSSRSASTWTSTIRSCRSLG